ncbi:MAG: GntR family transcriptional regulator [Erythrobacter sp.]|uniref:GntR family transcriptional regulator n=1 Tax=Erythrobacter sp. TaxID=1042 RepID=UPI00261EE7C9|nr:GntR family transcriptional regulator [Erythrobacter sp.]MDJ0977637.1 GntR family transcriptional regulator [Erythrobacter sp.]
MASKAAEKKPGKIPRYLQLAGELREDILAGAYTKDSPFPTETQLCRDYDVSRYTVREALRRLENEGLIQRKRGSGTTVQPAAARGGALHQPLSNVGELLQYAAGSKVTYAHLGACKLPAKIAEQIADPVPGQWSCYHGVRRHEADALPIAATHAYFHERLSDALSQLDLAKGTLFSQLEQLAGIRIGRITQDIQAIPATEAVAEALEIEANEPVLRILRCYYAPEGDIFEISVSHHPGDRFAYAMHIDVDG